MRHLHSIRSAPLLGTTTRLAALALFSLACSAADETDEPELGGGASSPTSRTEPAQPSAAPSVQAGADTDRAALERHVAPGAALLRDAARNPGAVRAAQVQFLGRLTPRDASIILDLLVRANDALLGKTDITRFALPADARELLQRYADIPYLGMFEGTAGAAAGSATLRPQSLGRLEAPLIELRFTPQCAPSCTEQTVSALVDSVGAELTAKYSIEFLAAGIPGAKTVFDLAKECGLEKRCTIEQYKEFAGELAIKLTALAIAPELALAIEAYELGKVVYEASKYHAANLRSCQAHQESPKCCSEPLSKCGDICCQGYESCCDGQCIDEGERCGGGSITQLISQAPAEAVEPASTGCCDTEVLFSSCQTLDGPPSYQVDCAAAPDLKAPPGCTPLIGEGGFEYCCPARIGKRC